MDQKMELKKGPWAEDEDRILKNYIDKHRILGRWESWDSVARNSGLRRSGSSCRLRWFNHLKPGIRREGITNEEMLLIIELRHELGGNKWSTIARDKRLHGRTDNKIKNFWNTRVKKKAKELNCDPCGEEFLKIMRKTFKKENQATASVGGIGGGGGATVVAPSFTTSTAYHADVDALSSSLFLDIIGVNGGTAAAAIAPYMITTADYAPQSNSFTTTTTADHASIAAEFASPSDNLEYLDSIIPSLGDFDYYNLKI